MEKRSTVVQENTLQVLGDTWKKIEGLKCFHIPIALQVIEDYKQAGIEGFFMEQQQIQLQKLYDMLAELESKAERLRQKLIND